MNQLKIIFLLLIVICFMGSMLIFLSKMHTNTPAPPVSIIEVAPRDLLEEAIQSVGMIGNDHCGGSFIIIGRNDQHNGKYLYHVLTCDHVAALLEENKDMEVVVQRGFHQLPLLFKTNISIDYSIKERDWAILSFSLNIKLPCATFATEQEFNLIKRFDPIYGVGGDSLSWLMSRVGTLSSTSNINVILSKEEQELLTSPYYKWANDFFHTTQPVAPGCSGGGVFSKDGKLIGMYTAFTMLNNDQLLTHSVICQKTFVIRKLIKDDSIIGVKE